MTHGTMDKGARPVATALATALAAQANCAQNGNERWFLIWDAVVAEIMAGAPSGSGIDCGTVLERDAFPAALRFTAEYHHMDEAGGYDGWTDHRVIVRPDWNGISLRVTGTNRNGIKDYLVDLYGAWLTSSVDWDRLVREAAAAYDAAAGAEAEVSRG